MMSSGHVLVDGFIHIIMFKQEHGMISHITKIHVYTTTLYYISYYRVHHANYI